MRSILKSLFAIIMLIAALSLFSFPAFAEDPPGDPADPIPAHPMIPENLPTKEQIPDFELPPCPADPGLGDALTGRDGTQVWWRDPSKYCHKLQEGWDKHAGYCMVNNFQNGPWTDVMVENSGTVCCSSNKGSKGWRVLIGILTNLAKNNPQACFVCGCIRGDHNRGGTGCFPPGVKISMADGSLKAIEKIISGDSVWNPRTKEKVLVKEIIEGPEELPLIKLGFADTLVTVSQDHPVLTEKGVKPANKLSKEDRVYDAKGDLHKLGVLQELPVREGQRVINLVLDAPSKEAEQRMMLSDGIVTGDIILQNELAK